jgi:hypothetical protein
MPTIVLVDHHPVVRAGVASLCDHADGCVPRNGRLAPRRQRRTPCSDASLEGVRLAHVALQVCCCG